MESSGHEDREWWSSCVRKKTSCHNWLCMWLGTSIGGQFPLEYNTNAFNDKAEHEFICWEHQIYLCYTLLIAMLQVILQILERQQFEQGKRDKEALLWVSQALESLSARLDFCKWLETRWFIQAIVQILLSLGCSRFKPPGVLSSSMADILDISIAIWLLPGAAYLVNSELREQSFGLFVCYGGMNDDIIPSLPIDGSRDSVFIANLQSCWGWQGGLYTITQEYFNRITYSQPHCVQSGRSLQKYNT